MHVSSTDIHVDLCVGIYRTYTYVSFLSNHVSFMNIHVSFVYIHSLFRYVSTAPVVSYGALTNHTLGQRDVYRHSQKKKSICARDFVHHIAYYTHTHTHTLDEYTSVCIWLHILLFDI